MTTQKKNVPALRFPEFQGEWQSQKLEQISMKISDGIHSTPQYDESGEYYFVNGNNLVGGKVVIFENTKNVNETEYLKHRKELNNKTILLSINGTIGSLALFNGEKIILGKSACYINLNEAADKMFIYNILQTSTVVNFFTAELTGSTIKNLSLATVKNCNLHLPTLPEQQKIAAFLTAVDEKIQQLAKKKDLLEQYKKGVMQKIFNQEIRFKDDNGNDFADWEEKHLFEVCKILYGKDQKQVADEKGIYPILGTGGEIGKTNSFLYDKPSVLIGRKGTIDKPRFMDTPFWTVDTLFYTEIFSNTFPKWLYYQFQLINWLSYNEASGVPSLSASTIYNIKINLPSNPEQERIANFLSALDNKIHLVNELLEKTQKYKKGLLQKMFV